MSRRLKLALALSPILTTPILILFVAEFAARIMLPPAIGPVLDSEPYTHLILTEAPRGITLPTRFTSNRWGMRSEDPPEVWAEWDTFIALGSSTTLCYHLDDVKTWSHLLEARLRARNPNTWVGNAGQEGVTAVSGALFAETLLPKLRPRVLLLMVGGTDVALSFSDEKRERGSPYDRGFQIRLENEASKTSWQERSRLVREYHLRRRRISGETATLDKSLHQSRFPAPLQIPEDRMPIDSIVQSPLAGFIGHVLRIRTLAADAGVRAVFITQPYLYGTDSTWSQREARTIEYRGTEYRISAATERGLLDRFNSTLLGLCRDKGMECLDLASQIPSDSVHFYDEGHFTETGAALAADKIADYFLREPKTP